MRLLNLAISSCVGNFQLLTLAKPAATSLYFIPVEQQVHPFDFCFVLPKFSFTLNFTILVMRLAGSDLSTGNFTEPFAPS